MVMRLEGRKPYTLFSHSSASVSVGQPAESDARLMKAVERKMLDIIIPPRATVACETV